MRRIAPIMALLLGIYAHINAEGTRELAPNASIVVNGNPTTDLAALHINHPAYNNFAAYDNADSHSRLYIHIKDPSKECIFLGFSFGHLNVTSPNPTRIQYEYRIKDPSGNIVFGPVTVATSGGNIPGWSEAFTGPMEIYGAGGYDAVEVTSADLASQGWDTAGDYYIEFQTVAGNDLLIDFWDISVADCSIGPVTEKKGRIWSYNWSIFAVNDFGFPNRPFNGAFYVCAPDPADAEAAFITKIDFNGAGFRPAAFNVAFNSFGIQNSGNIAEDRKSVQLLNATQSEYAIFLNDPVELCKTALVGEIDLIGIGRCTEGSYCIKVNTTKEGQIDLLLDFDGPDNVYTPGSRDVLLSHFVTSDQVGVPFCIEWDGLDGFGSPLPEIAGAEIPIVISYAQGIYHFPIYDAELMITGFMLEAVRPAASIPLLHYDDSNITVPSGSGEPAVNISGCNVPCHRWTNFIDNTIPGFGNLHTINSWWFSQRILKEDILVIPAIYNCGIQGPASICAGSTAQIFFQPEVQPTGLDGPEIISSAWSGPGIIGAADGDTIEIGTAGTYSFNFSWISGVGDTCHSSCEYELVIDPPLTASIDTLILEGTIITINGEQYGEGGQYVQHLSTSGGCDSILTINIKVINTVIYYDLDACWSFMSDGSHMDYSEFTATQPQPLSCADISASIVFRENPQMNKHSCTPGVDNSVAMCIHSLDTCDYDAGNQASLIFEISVSPDPDTAVQVTGISFFEQAPLTYNWISGDSGPNNYPTLFGIRVLKNGVEIFRQEGIPTNNDWTEKIFSFLDNDEFIVDADATFRFELLPYCLAGVNSLVAAWDIDEVSVEASCVSPSELNKVISGVIKTPAGISVDLVDVMLASNPQFTDVKHDLSDGNGRYLFESNERHQPYYIFAERNTDYLEGVSTLDLIQIQKHLLGIRPFTSAYQSVAADADKNAKITALDLIALRKLILGITDVLPNNKSWRFGHADASYEDSYPWGFKETIGIESLTEDISDADFYAVKVGDVNTSFGTNFTGDIEIRSSTAFKLDPVYHKNEDGRITRIDLKSGDAYEIAGLQLALNTGMINVSAVSSELLTLHADHYVISNGYIVLSWNDIQSTDLQKGDVLFSLHVSPATYTETGKIFIDRELMSAEAYDFSDLQVMDIEFNDGEEIMESTVNMLDQNQPNPFTDHTIIPFELAQPGYVSITFNDMTGRVLKRYHDYYLAGKHHIEVTGRSLGFNNGIIVCRMESNEFSAAILMVKQ